MSLQNPNLLKLNELYFSFILPKFLSFDLSNQLESRLDP
jgi:hypothetical protein